MRNQFITWMSAVLLIIVSPKLLAQGETGTTQQWQFEVTPYIWGTAMEGSTGTTGVTADVDASFSDIWDRLDEGFLGVFEASNGQWHHGVEVIYMKLAGETARSWSGPGGIGTLTGQLDVTSTLTALQYSLGYRVQDEKTKVDVIGAARYTEVEMDLVLVTTTGPLLPGGTRQLDASKSWVDPVIGVRVLHPLSEKWLFVGYADIGGFGIGSDITYQALAGLNWQFAKDFSAKFGYRYLYQDYDDDGFIWDMTSQGIYAGLGIRF